MTEPRTPIRVALTMRVTNAKSYDEPRDSIAHDWIDRLQQWGAVPIPMPNGIGDPMSYLNVIAPDLLVLTGGEDPGGSSRRDTMERKLLSHAIASGLPVLGVCRGLQFMNLYFGGTLSDVDGHVARHHEIVVDPDWSSMFGSDITVNSFHRMGIRADGLADDLKPFAWDSNGMVEGAYHRNLYVAGVMWHPERPQAPSGDAALVHCLAAREAFWK